MKSAASSQFIYVYLKITTTIIIKEYHHIQDISGKHIVTQYSNIAIIASYHPVWQYLQSTAVVFIFMQAGEAGQI